MFKPSLIAALLTVAMAGVPALAQDHATPHIERQNWTFAGVFGTFDKEQLQRGFQVFREVCAGCHSARLLAFRNLSEKGGPEFSEAQVKALAAEYEIVDPEAEGGSRRAIAADRWPPLFANDAEAREAFGGVIPPDLSVMAKARGVSDPFPTWALNYFTAYGEGGPDYIHALLTSYQDEPPHGVAVPEGSYYNAVFPGNSIAMPPPLSDDLVSYAEGVPTTIEQYSTDVSAFMMWMAEPHLVDRKETGFRVIAFLILFAGLMYFVKNRLWRPVYHPEKGGEGGQH